MYITRYVGKWLEFSPVYSEAVHSTRYVAKSVCICSGVRSADEGRWEFGLRERTYAGFEGGLSVRIHLDVPDRPCTATSDEGATEGRFDPYSRSLLI